MRIAAFLVATLAASPAFALDAIIMASQPNDYGLDLQTTLINGGAYTTVDVWAANTSTPVLGDLLNYDVVYLQFDAGYADPTALGDVLADYVDAGGGVVAPTFEFAFPSLNGRFESGSYMPFQANFSYYTVDDRLASNTGGFSGPYLSGQFNSELPTLTPGATLLASYDDGNPLVAAHAPSGAGIVISGNDYAVSNNVGRSDFWDVGYDGITFWSNLGVFATNGGLPTQFRTSATGTCGGAAQINTFDATPNGTLVYASGTPGASTIPSGPCAGRSLPIRQPRIRATRTANNQGRDTINIGALNPNFCGGTYVVVDVATCSVASATLPL